MKRKVIGILLIISISLICTSCNSRLSLLNSSSKEELEIIYETEESIIEALENEDDLLLKSIFSKKALSKAVDIEDGIDYVFSLYEGDFIKIVDRGHTSTGYYGPEGCTYKIRGWFIIETSIAEYEISYNLWSVQEIDPTAVGVFTLRVEEYVEENNKSYWSMAGIETPNREVVHDTLSVIYDSLNNEDSNMLSTVFGMSDEDDSLNKSCEDVVSILGPKFIYSNIGDGWLIYDGITFHVYAEVYFAPSNYILYFRYDTTPGNEDKVYLMKFTEIKEGTSLDDYELGENLTEPGIYLE